MDNIKKCVVCKMNHFENDFGVNRLNQPYRSCIKCRERSVKQYQKRKENKKNILIN